MMPRLRRLLVLLLAIPAVLAAQETVTTIEIDRIQLGVYLSPETEQMMGRESRTLLRAVETALSARGMGAAVRGMPGRFVAYIDLAPLEERMLPGGGMVALKEQLTVTFGDQEGGRAMGAYVTERTATGRTKEVALRNFATALNLRTDDEWNEALDDANRAIIAHFETECPAILREADAKARLRLFEEAVYLVTSVPRQAKGCHAQAAERTEAIYTAYLRAQCTGPFAQGQASWRANRSRENAQKVADLIGTIPADSPCFGEAATLMDQVAQVIATYDASDAKARVEKVAFKRKRFDDLLAFSREELAKEQQVEAGRVEAEKVRSAATTEAAKELGVAFVTALAQKQPEPETKVIVLRQP